MITAARNRRRSLAARLGGGVIVVVILSSCSAAQPSETSSTTLPSETYGADEIAVRVLSCLEDAGFSAELDPDGGLKIPLGDQREIIMETHDRCVADLIDEGHIAPPRVPTEAELRDRYERLVEVADCLESLGYTIESPPSVDTFVDTGGEVWHPYLYLPDATTAAQFAEASERCPQP